MSAWGYVRRGDRPTDLTWMPEDIELAPDWVRQEMLREPDELRSWLAEKLPPNEGGQQIRRGKGGRRGRHPKQ